ncbi:hypothetical protein [Hirschia litorea]|uniref:Uncharacterized protein n=1 Tax=Hirschia litorea TaxID=1199156 RepID=A0ABW2IK21_9PROT
MQNSFQKLEDEIRSTEMEIYDLERYVIQLKKIKEHVEENQLFSLNSTINKRNVLKFYLLGEVLERLNTSRDLSTKESAQRLDGYSLTELFEFIEKQINGLKIGTLSSHLSRFKKEGLISFDDSTGRWKPK